MNAKQELTNRMMDIASDGITLTPQRILDILFEYKVDHCSQLTEMDFRRQIEHFLFAKKSEGIADGTEYNYRLHLNLFCTYTNKSATDVSTNDIRNYIAYLSAVKGNKVNTIQSIINTLRSFFGWLVLEDVIAKDPTKRIKPLKFDKNECRHALSHEQLELVRDACVSYRDKAIVEFLYSSGCRISEATQIDLSKVDFNQRSVSVVGKGNKRRTVFFSVRARLMIQLYLRERGGGTALFCSERRPHNRLGSRAIQRIIKDIGARAGVDSNICPHMFRHTLATNLLASGVDITIIQKILGHSNVNTTQIYAETSDDAARREHYRFVA